MREYDLIEKIIKNFPRSSAQRNRFMSCDAEILEVNGQQIALTVDDFSPEEDLFTDDNPEILGHNLVVATLSDLYAVGANPLFFLQALTLKKDIDESFLTKLTTGIQNTLNEANCFLAGGDLSVSQNWRFTGIALGAINNGKFIQRILPIEPQILWVTGALGDANLAILTKSPTPKFELRMEAAELIKCYATTCIDTSSGLFDAIYCLSQQKPEITIELNLDRIPLTKGTIEFVKQIDIPKEAVLVGGAGEYELLFSTPKNIASRIKRKFYNLGILPIGTTYFDNKIRGILVSSSRGKKRIENPPPCPRATNNFDEYCKLVLEFANNLIIYE